MCVSNLPLLFELIMTTVDENFLRNLLISLLAIALTTEGGAHPPGFTEREREREKVKHQDTHSIVAPYHWQHT